QPDQRVELVAVLSPGAVDEPVVQRVDGGGEQHPVEPHMAALGIDYILVPRALGGLHDDVNVHGGLLQQCCYPGSAQAYPATRRTYHGHMGLIRAGSALYPAVADNDPATPPAGPSGLVGGPPPGRAAAPFAGPQHAVGRLAVAVAGDAALARAAALARDQVEQFARVAPEQQARDRPHSATSSAHLHDITRMPIP